MQPQIREATVPPNLRGRYLEAFLSKPFTLMPAERGVSSLRGRYGRPLVTILIAAALVLLIACANIANLLLARASARRHEISVRCALGASRWQLARQFLTEGLVLAGIGTATGLLFAMWSSALLVQQFATPATVVFLDLSLHWRVLGFTAAVGIVTVILFATAPAFLATRVNPIDVLRNDVRGGARRWRIGVGGGLIVTQVALSLVLLTATGLFLRTFSTLVNRDLGFDREKVLVVSLNMTRSKVKAEGRAATYERARQAVTALPGVASAGVSAITPVSGTWRADDVQVLDRPLAPDRDRSAYSNFVSPGWFSTYGTRILAGREFDAGDSAGTQPVIIVNETFARTFMDGAAPLGRFVQLSGAPVRERLPIEIVGLARDAVYRSLRDPVPPTVYLPLAQWKTPTSTVGLSVRAVTDNPAALTKAVTNAIAGVDPGLAFTIYPLADHVNGSLVQERLVAMLSTFFGALGLLLAALGLYGVTSYSMSRSRDEIGIRMALGASAGSVVRVLLVRVFVLVVCGILVGWGISLWASRFLAALLYGLEPHDVPTLAAAAVVLLAVSTLAGWLPASRASRIDPVRVLREIPRG